MARIPELSADKAIRRGQMRNLAREASRQGGWGASDPIGQIASMLEAVYQQGIIDAGRKRSESSPESPIPWEAIPKRSREILSAVGKYREFWPDIFEGKKAIILTGAARRIPTKDHETGERLNRGAKTWLTLWDTSKRIPVLIESDNENWPVSCASALVKLGIFKETNLTGNPGARLTARGINSYDEAMHLGILNI